MSPLNNVPPEIVTTKGVGDVINFTSLERGKNVIIVACCSASGAFIPLLFFQKGSFQGKIHAGFTRKI